MKSRPDTLSTGNRSWGIFPVHASSLLRELPVMLGGLALFYALLALAHRWMAPVTESTVELAGRPAPEHVTVAASMPKVPTFTPAPTNCPFELITGFVGLAVRAYD